MLPILEKTVFGVREILIDKPSSSWPANGAEGLVGTTPGARTEPGDPVMAPPVNWHPVQGPKSARR